MSAQEKKSTDTLIGKSGLVPESSNASPQNASVKGNYKDKGFFRRQYPRRFCTRPVGVLCRGKYFMAETVEMGEGGMALASDQVFTVGHQMVINLQIPNGDFVSLRATVRSARKDKGRCVHGLSFENIQFHHKRQIRSFVSSRSDSEGLLF